MALCITGSVEGHFISYELLAEVPEGHFDQYDML